ncbi:GntR family transcriptional regulator [Novosphingobium sp. BL-52-GroH]|uniref:GntR family transcriptional regulator n=1 Tax=Novosphingobium sp. BL-52-GroH TaxID=3349877 RepID=UPI00384D6F7E
MMAPEPVTAHHIHGLVRQEIVAGAYTPGMILNLNRLTHEFGTSSTPVRDAMNRLVGERLVEHLPGGGFRVRALSPDRLAGLYEWHGQLLRLALASALPESVREQVSALARRFDEPGHVAPVAGAAFGIVVSVSRNEELARAFEAVALTLARARALEHLVIPGAVDELSQVIATIAAKDVAASRRIVGRYHRNRIRLSPRIHNMLRPTTAGIGQKRP